MANEKLTEVLFIIDKSGSMSGLEKSTREGFDSVIDEQSDSKDTRVIVSTVLFDTGMRVLHDRLDISEVGHLQEKDYQVGGGTAFLDAASAAINHIGEIHKRANFAEVPAHTLVVIITDGQENSSRRTSVEDLKRIIERQQKRFGWVFMFLGANMDAVTTAGSYGIPGCDAANYVNDEEGVKLCYSVISKSIGSMRAHKPRERWKDEIEEDSRRRGRW